MKFYRVKTKEELGGRPPHWNRGGLMDDLFGAVFTEDDVIVKESVGMISLRTQSGSSWLLAFLDYEEITLIEYLIRLRFAGTNISEE